MHLTSSPIFHFCLINWWDAADLNEKLIFDFTGFSMCYIVSFGGFNADILTRKVKIPFSLFKMAIFIIRLKLEILSSLPAIANRDG